MSIKFVCLAEQKQHTDLLSKYVQQLSLISLIFNTAESQGRNDGPIERTNQLKLDKLDLDCS